MQNITSLQMRSVLIILRAAPPLMEAVRPYLNLEVDVIYWDRIWKLFLNTSHRNALLFAYSLWADEPRPRCNPFSLALEMSPLMRRACLKALAHRWGFTES